MSTVTLILASVITILCVDAGIITRKRYTPTFYDGVRVATVTTHYVTEASGLCASRIHTNVLYTHNDSGDSSRVYAIDSTNGNLLAKITVSGANSRDWEDIACGPCQGGQGHCIYIANTGGNTGYDENTIYRITEPASLHDQTVQIDSTLQFRWDQHDCETVMVDPNGEVYIVSKNHNGHGKLVHLPSYAWGTHHRVQVNEGVYLPINTPDYDPVGGDISSNGHMVLLKTYRKVFYWYVQNGDYYSAMRGTPTQMPYTHERQGESVCFAKDESGYYTLGEGSHSPLYFYRLKSLNVGSG